MSTDPILLTIYLLTIVLFIFRIYDSFNDEYTIKLDAKALDSNLEEKAVGEKKLSEIVGIGFSFDKRYEFKGKLNKLSISINNKSEDYIVYADWDYSTITDLEGKARRVTRILPGMTLDLFQNQVFSTIAPKTALKESITAEDLLQRKKDKDEYELPDDKTLIDLLPAKPSDGLKKKLNYFKKRLPDSDLEFFLDLALRFTSFSSSSNGHRFHILCKFTLTKYPWYVGVPWNPK